jgi:hypothetical protein
MKTIPERELADFNRRRGVDDERDFDSSPLP